MSYFFDLEDFYTTCRALGDVVSKSIGEDETISKNNYFQQYGNLDGYKPTQNTVNLNSDGSIGIFVNDNNNNGNKIPLEMGGFCCTNRLPYIIQQKNIELGVFAGVDTTNIYWDANKQKCRWKQESESEYCALDSFKVILNAVDNDGAMFNVDDDDRQCSLTIDFDYLFKMDCQNLANILNPSINTNTNPTLLNNIKNLQNDILQVQVNCSQITSDIDLKNKDFLNSNYSIIDCNTNKLYCIQEQNGGLTQWENILGPVRYQRFLNGDSSLDTCAEFNAMYQLNNQLNNTNKPLILIECNTPFGYKTDLKTQLDDLIRDSNACQAQVDDLEVQLNTLLVELDIPSTCTSPIEALETLDVSMTLEVVESDGSLASVFESPLFPAIGTGNLYPYLKLHPYNSGFYICSDDSTGTCVPLNYGTELTGPTAPFGLYFESIGFGGDNSTNFAPCDTVKDSLLTDLKKQSGLGTTAADLANFKGSLANTIFESKWLNFSTVIDDTNILNLIKNKKIKLSLKINNTCSNVCIYIDNIKLLRTCIDGNGKSVLISESPGFQLDRVIDNKKSWVRNYERVNRTFDIANNQGSNIIRTTNYDVNDERLVINTKEIDLDINIASAIENDVQCYINDNLGLLESVPSTDCACKIHCYKDNIKIIDYSDAVNSGLISTPLQPEDLMNSVRAIRDAWLKAWNELMRATPPYLDTINGVYHPNPSEDVMTTYRATRDAWMKALHEFNLASGGGFIEGLTVDEEFPAMEQMSFYTSYEYSLHENLAPMMFNTECGRILKMRYNQIDNNAIGALYFVETPETKELKVYLVDSNYAPRNTTWIDITSLVQEDYPANWDFGVHTPERAPFYCKLLNSSNYVPWAEMISFHYQTNNNTAHDAWINFVDNQFFIDWDSKKGKCVTNKFKQVVAEEFSMNYPIISKNVWVNYENINYLGVSPECIVDIYLRNSGSTFCTGYNFSWPSTSADISTIYRAYAEFNLKLRNQIKTTENEPWYYIYILDTNTNMAPDQSGGEIQVKVTTTIRKGSRDGNIVFQEEYVLNDSTASCDLRKPNNGFYGNGLSQLRVPIGVTDPNSAYRNPNYTSSSNTYCASDYGTYIAGSTSTLPFPGASANGIDRNWEFDENYYVHFDVVNNTTNQVYLVTNNDFNLKDRPLQINCPSSASTQTFNINTALNSINTFKTTILGEIQEDLDDALSVCINC